MKKLAFAVVALTVAFTGAASARDLVTATLAAPLAQPEKVVAAAVVWNCEGQSCTAIMREQPSARSCRALAREVGAMTAFGSQERQLDEEALAACNERARQTQTASAN